MSYFLHYMTNDFMGGYNGGCYFFLYLRALCFPEEQLEGHTLQLCVINFVVHTGYMLLILACTLYNGQIWNLFF